MEGISVEQAVEQILQHTPVINETEETELNKAGGRVLAQDMVAGFDNPPFDRSPVDGYACKAEDLAGAAKEHPVRLKVMEEIDAGQYSEREIQQGELSQSYHYTQTPIAVFIRRIPIMAKIR